MTILEVEYFLRLSVQVIQAAFIFFYFPLAVFQSFMIVYNIRTRRKAKLRNAALTNFPGRRVLVMLTTNGKATAVSEHILSTLREYGLPLEYAVVRESYDTFNYSAQHVTVPADYQTPKGSIRKMRAQHYGAQWLQEAGYGAETYVVHLDDDSIPSKGYMETVFKLRAEAGQGEIRLRKDGVHLFSTLADFVRVSDCDTYCDFFNSRGHPMAVHGEGLVLRADVESALGWDFATFGAEDFFMGQRVVQAGYTFDIIPEHVYIAPPITTKDFYAQRRRWIYSVFWSRQEIRKLRPLAMWWFTYRYSIGLMGVFGGATLLYTALTKLYLPSWIGAMGVFNLVGYFVFYQYGAHQTNSKKYSLKMLLLQIPIAIYEGGTLIYSVFRPPNRTAPFDSIQKV